MRLGATAWLPVALAVALASLPAWAAAEQPVTPAPQSESAFDSVARSYRLDPDLLRAIAWVESGGDPYAVSPKGAMGLMQLMPATAKTFGVDDPFDPLANLLGAARFLRRLKEQPSLAANLPLLLAAYNAGASAVQRYHGIPPYDETRRYVRRVLLDYLLGPIRPLKLSGVTLRRRRLLVGRMGPDLAGFANTPRRPKDPFEQLLEIRRQRTLAARNERADIAMIGAQ